MKTLLSILPCVLLVFSAFGQTQGVSLRSTNGVAFSRLTVQSHISATNTGTTNTFAGLVQQQGLATTTAAAAFGLNTLASGTAAFVTGNRNQGHGAASLIGGQSNVVSSTALYSLVVGELNQVGNRANFVSGSRNSSDGIDSAVIGADITMDTFTDHDIVLGRNILVNQSVSNCLIANFDPSVLFSVASKSNSILLNAPGGTFFSGGPVTSTDGFVGPITPTGSNNFVGSFTGNGAGLTNVNGVSIIGLGASANGVTDDTAIIQSAVNTVGGLLFFPKGTYLITDTITITNNAVTLVGEGINKTFLLFNPVSGGKPALKFSKGASLISMCGIRKLSIITDATGVYRIGIDLSDVNGFTAEDFSINPFSGSDSIGILWRGRDSSRFNRFNISCDRPIVISTNDNSTISIDHTLFDNAALIAATNRPCITISNNVNMTQTVFDRNSWNLGSYGIQWLSPAASQYSTDLTVKNTRMEQEVDTNGYVIQIQSALQDLKLVDVQGAVTGNFLSVSNVLRTSLEHCNMTRTSGTSVWASGASEIAIRDSYFAPGATAVMGGLTNFMEFGVKNIGQPFAPTSLWGLYGIVRAYQNTTASVAVPLVTLDNPSGDSVNNGTSVGFYASGTRRGGVYSHYVGPPANWSLSLGADAIDQLLVATGGNVAIGNTAPAAKLDVTGDICASTTITATNFFLLPTNYVAANFAPTAGMVKIVSSNGAIFSVTQLSTNLIAGP